jgi:hypothetical protein
VLRFFRSSRTAGLVIIILLGGLLWLHAFLNAGQDVENRHGMFGFQIIAGWLEHQPQPAVWCGFLLTMAVAMTLIVVNSLNLIDKISHIPALCYVLLIGGVPAVHQFNPAIFAVIFLILAFIQLILSFRSERLSYMYFSAPAFIAVATFFYQYAYLFMPVVWCCLLLFRPGYWREWVFSILGFFFPFLWLFGWYYLVEDDYTRIFSVFEAMFSIQGLTTQPAPSTILFFGLNTLLGIFGCGYLLRHIGSRKIIVRDGYYLLILITIITLIMTVVIPDIFPFSWYLLAFPLSFCLSYYLTYIRSVRRGNIFLLFLFISVGAAQFIHSFL